MSLSIFGYDLERARESKGMSGPDLARELKVSANAVHKWENNLSFPRPDKWKDIEAATGINPQRYKDKDRFTVVEPTVKAYEAAKPEPSNISPAFSTSPAKDVPLISWVQAGNWQGVEDPFSPGDADTWYSTNKTKSGYAFALKVHGDSMEPRFLDGDVIIVDPERPPENGSYVIAKNGDEATFKQLVRDGESVFLKPLNSRYPIRDMTGIDFKIVGVVVQCITDY